jgi:deoxyribodipyrimidine photolyase-related protein
VICRKKYVLFVKDHLLGEKNGRKTGQKLSIAAKNVGEIKPMNSAINLIFPHQLFAESPLLDNGKVIYLMEEFLFFKQYKFHKQKIAFHRASMKNHQAFLEAKGLNVNYIDSTNPLSDIRNFIKENGDLTEINVIDPVDNWLEKRLSRFNEKGKLIIHPNPQFLNNTEDLNKFFKPDKKSFFQTSFYIEQRKRLGVLIDENQQAIGGSWSFDKENRKKYPKGKTPPSIHYPETTIFWKEAVYYTEKYFPNHLGTLSNEQLYPINHQESEAWFEQFLHFRFHEFGAYEDAMVKNESILHHSLLSPLINAGLILPNYILTKTLQYAQDEGVPINSTEGFVRQLIGWREFIRGMYICKGTYARTRNFWEFKRKIPASFYNGTTGIEPVDSVIKEVLKTGYCHHIERLMILGNFMLLCEFHPDDVYQWFMELFIDAYDWVMVPNVYGMSQFADGGTFATKPYISGSNYIKKMSNFGSGEWEQIWDGLFWRFMAVHQDFFKSNSRISMLYYAYQKMPEEKKQMHLRNANSFLERLG